MKEKYEARFCDIVFHFSCVFLKSFEDKRNATYTALYWWPIIAESKDRDRRQAASWGGRDLPIRIDCHKHRGRLAD